MSATKKAPALLVTTEARGTTDDEGNVEVEEIKTEIEPVIVEYVDEESGEVVYDAAEAKGGSSVGYSRTYAANWESAFGKKDEHLPN